MNILKDRFISRVSFILLIAAGLFLPPPARASLVANWPTVTIDGVSYVPLDTLSGVSGFLYQWDPLLKNAVVSGANGSLKVHIGSEFILEQGNVIRLDAKVRMSNGSVLAPLSVEPYLTGLMGEKGLSAVSATPLLISTHRIKKIVIDAGHGGQDFGATSPWGVKGKDITLRLAEAVRGDLERAGVQVVMTRAHDVFVPLPERARIANKTEADLFISIHANASPAKSLKGFEVYYLSEAADDVALALSRSEESPSEQNLDAAPPPSGEARAILWDLKEAENRRQSIRTANAVSGAVNGTVEISANRIRSARFYVLKWTECPSVLVETGYLTNREDERRLENERYQEDLASAIVRGILNYKEEFERTDGFTR